MAPDPIVQPAVWVRDGERRVAAGREVQQSGRCSMGRGCVACLANRWSRRGCRRDEIVNGWEVALRVTEGAGQEPPRGSAPPLEGAST